MEASKSRSSPIMKPADEFLPHLDGLRAVAILGVLLFHFQVPFFQGGFAGVDIFFSISGFLITRNVLRSLNEGEFKLFDFYKRRFFRLIPALTVVCATTVLFSLLCFQKLYSRPVFSSARAALLFHSNVYFYTTTNYFNRLTRFKPLIHTWSLSLEEQFYLVWPIFLMCVHRSRHGSSAAFFLIVCSIQTGSLYGREFHSFSFYLLPTRTHQFVLGALPCLLSQPNSCKAASFRLKKESGVLQKRWYQFWTEFLSSSALILILKNFICLHRMATPLQMLPTTLATCVLIVTPKSFFATHVLSHPAAVFLGKLSYSAYLVHWPLSIFARFFSAYFFLQEPKMGYLFMGTFCFATILKNGVEDPLRRSSRRSQSQFIVLFVLVVLLCSYFDRYGSPLPVPYGPPGNGLPKGVQRHLILRGMKKLHAHNLSPMSAIQHIIVGNTQNGSKSDVVLFGNSFAGHLLGAFSEVGWKRGLYFEVYWRGMCLLNPRIWHSILPGCEQAQTDFWERIDALPNNSHVVVANGVNFMTSSEVRGHSRKLYKDITKAGHSLSIFGHPPRIQVDVLNLFMDCSQIVYSPIAAILNLPSQPSYRGAAHCIDLNNGKGVPPVNDDWQFKEIRDELVGLPRFRLLDFFDVMCRNVSTKSGITRLCQPPFTETRVIHDIGMQSDGGHLTTVGSWHHFQYIDSFLFNKSSLK